MLVKSTTVSQTAKFSWVGDICSSEGTYRSSLYTQSQIRNTHRLVMTYDCDLQTGQILPLTIAEVGRENVTDLDREYERKSIELAGLDLAKTPYWQNLKAQKIVAMNDTGLYDLLNISNTSITESN